MASARIQRWALTLSAYDYTISYKPGKDQASADLLSRLPLAGFPNETPTPADTTNGMSRDLTYQFQSHQVMDQP